MFAVYQVTNGLNGDSYVGFTSLSPYIYRWTQHKNLSKLGSTTHFHKALRKYGVENFKWEVLEEGLDPEIGKNIREPYWISVLKPEYNETKGGDGILGYKHTKEWKRIKSLQVAGSKHSNETLLLQAESLKKYWEKNDTRKENLSHIMVGNKYAHGSRHTESWKGDLSKRLMGNTFTLGHHWKQKTIICPYCQKSGGLSSMKRWHLDNCEHK